MTAAESSLEDGEAATEPTKPLPGAGTPEGDALARATRAFELGSYAEVRRLCGPLRSSSSAEVADAANALLRRISVDPMQIAVLVGSFGLFAWIVFHYVL
jgi:hypothetical protein